jgi:hypothetical protein
MLALNVRAISFEVYSVHPLTSKLLTANQQNTEVKQKKRNLNFLIHHWANKAENLK